MNQISDLNQYQQNVNVTISGNRGIIANSDNTNTSSQNTGNILQPGEIFQGQIVGMDGDHVRLLLNEGMILNAKLDQEIQMLLGQKMIFAVRGNADSQISISPLFENMAKQETGHMALKEAGLPITDNNLKLVSLLMQEGLSIDKNTLGLFQKYTNQFPTVPMTDLVQVHKLGIPVNEQNITQFQQYTQNQNQLLHSITDILEQLPESYAQQAVQNGTTIANQVFSQILQIFQGGNSMTAGNQENVVGENVQNAELVNENGNVQNDVLKNGILQEESASRTDDISMGEKGSVISNTDGKNGALSQTEITQNPQGTDGINPAVSQAQNKENVSNVMQTLQNMQNTQQSNITNYLPLSKPELQELLHNLKNLGIDERVLKQIAHRNIDAGELLQNIGKMIQNHTDLPVDSMKQLLQSSSFQKVLKEAVGRQWLITPDELKEENGVARFYERLGKQTQQLLTILQEGGMQQSTLGKTAQNMNANVNFINDMNHMFTYMQLPLRFSENQAHSELYVYTNKKSLARQQGEVSALLHLDMDHIGTLDIHVLLQNSEKVSTRFVVQDEEIMDLLYDHIDILNQQLAKKGYKMTTNIQISEDDKNVMQEILQDNKKNVPISMYTFDARA